MAIPINRIEEYSSDVTGDEIFYEMKKNRSVLWLRTQWNVNRISLKK